MYLFFDELQTDRGMGGCCKRLPCGFDCDIYVTGSNAYLLSSEYSTYLSGRCVEIKMLPLSFREFLDFHGFEVRETTECSVDSASRYLIRTVNATNCEKFLTPICASVECPESPMLGWNRKRHCRFSTASIPQS